MIIALLTISLVSALIMSCGFCTSVLVPGAAENR